MMMDSVWGNFFGFLIFILDIVAIVDVVRSSKSIGMKVLWTLVIIVLPLVGLILYFLFGRERPVRI